RISKNSISSDCLLGLVRNKGIKRSHDIDLNIYGALIGGNCARSPTNNTITPPKGNALLCNSQNILLIKSNKCEETIEISSKIRASTFLNLILFSAFSIANDI